MNLDSRYGDDLLDTILKLDSVEEAKKFFSDLCSVNEIVLMQQRFAVAKMLHQNITYQDITKETGASTATISRVSRALNYGEGGYLSVLGKQDNADA